MSHGTCDGSAFERYDLLNAELLLRLPEGGAEFRACGTIDGRRAAGNRDEKIGLLLTEPEFAFFVFLSVGIAQTGEFCQNGAGFGRNADLLVNFTEDSLLQGFALLNSALRKMQVTASE